MTKRGRPCLLEQRCFCFEALKRPRSLCECVKKTVVSVVLSKPDERTRKELPETIFEAVHDWPSSSARLWRTGVRLVRSEREGDQHTLGAGRRERCNTKTDETDATMKRQTDTENKGRRQACRERQRPLIHKLSIEDSKVE
eukprot:6201362-Pleurochrysis_carterae.AAC.1